MKAKNKIDLKKYEKIIPKNCLLQTAKEHAEHLLFCWGLVDQLKAGEKISKICDAPCECNTLLPKRIKNAPLHIMIDYVKYNPEWKKIVKDAQNKLDKKNKLVEKNLFIITGIDTETKLKEVNEKYGTQLRKIPVNITIHDGEFIKRSDNVDDNIPTIPYEDWKKYSIFFKKH